MITLKARHHLRHGLLGNAECYVYESDAGSVAVAIVYGRIVPEEEILVRIQSACLYGAVMLATDCDCRAQLNQSMRDIREAGCGVIIHLDQEGRGAGLITKAMAYELHDRNGLDTVEAYQHLNVQLDSRNYDIAIHILKELNIERVHLITNNPLKIAALEEAHLAVTRMRQPIAATDANIDYLRVKAEKLGHWLDLPSIPSVDQSGRTIRATVVGAAVMDHILRMPHNPTLGSPRQAVNYIRQPGGRGLNQAVAFSRLGGLSALLTSRGADSDALIISEALVAESVKTWFIDTSEIRSPQTIVLRPRDNQPTYIGWLTSEHRALPAQRLSRWSAEIRESDVVIFTTEPSPKTFDTMLSLLPERTLTILHAAPVVEGRQVSTNLLERIDVVIGSVTELHAIYGDTDESERTTDIIKSLTDLCGLTVIVTDLKAPVRTVVGFNQELQDPVIVESPAVRMPERSVPVVGNRDVFTAAFAMESVVRKHRQDEAGEKLGWQGSECFFGRQQNVLDVLLEAVVAEAWVVKSGSDGYLVFPRKRELAKWAHQPPRVVDPREVDSVLHIAPSSDARAIELRNEQ